MKRTNQEEKAMNNIPKVKIGIVAVSRDCFPESLSVNRRKALVDAYKAKYDAEDIYECPVCIVESEIHMVQALGCPRQPAVMHWLFILKLPVTEISETLLAKHFDRPAMFVAAAEDQNGLSDGRGDAACCGMLNASYNLKLRNIAALFKISVKDAAGAQIANSWFVPDCTRYRWSEGSEIISFSPRDPCSTSWQCTDQAAATTLV